MLDRIFDVEGPLAKIIFRIRDLLVINILTILFLIPVFTIGPALKALAFSSLKLVREEDGNVVKTYWVNFKMNFKQTVLFGLACLLLMIIVAGDIYSLTMIGKAIPAMIKVPAVIVLVLIFGVLLYAIPMQGRFLNPVMTTFKNAFWASLMKFPKTLIMMACWLVIPGFYLFVSANFFPLIILFGFSLPAYLNALVYDPFFRDIEDRITAKNKTKDENEGNIDNL